ncbi:hypothetical protein KJ567_04080, partial [Candidatus Bipolaricaulota bacterium]|nr:hypothetical protein [Candidatus Bipolaricaulota bacterium]
GSNTWARAARIVADDGLAEILFMLTAAGNASYTVEASLDGSACHPIRFQAVGQQPPEGGGTCPIGEGPYVVQAEGYDAALERFVDFREDSGIDLMTLAYHGILVGFSEPMDPATLIPGVAYIVGEVPDTYWPVLRVLHPQTVEHVDGTVVAFRISERDAILFGQSSDEGRVPIHCRFILRSHRIRSQAGLPLDGSDLGEGPGLYCATGGKDFEVRFKIVGLQ